MSRILIYSVSVFVLVIINFIYCVPHRQLYPYAIPRTFRGQFPNMRPFPQRFPFPMQQWSTLPGQPLFPQQPGQPFGLQQPGGLPSTNGQPGVTIAPQQTGAQPVIPEQPGQPIQKSSQMEPPQPGQLTIIPAEPTVNQNATNYIPTFNGTDFDNSTFPLTRSFFPNCVVDGCAAGKDCDAATKVCRESISGL
ncbi:hypothetical protein CHUAL_012618 [Chamberlinius hualienensis]